jgi:hypothetical protein
MKTKIKNEECTRNDAKCGASQASSNFNWTDGRTEQGIFVVRHSSVGFYLVHQNPFEMAKNSISMMAEQFDLPFISNLSLLIEH